MFLKATHVEKKKVLCSFKLDALSIYRMVWFQAFRGEFGYSNFGEYRTSAIVDIQFVAIIYTCVLISVATVIVAAGIRGKEVS